MGIIIFLIVVSVILTASLFIGAYLAAEAQNDLFLISVASGFIGFFTSIMSIIFIISLFFWKSSEVKIKIINNKYDTNYTVEEMFWADDVIDKIIRTEEEMLDSNNRIELDIKK